MKLNEDKVLSLWGMVIGISVCIAIVTIGHHIIS